MSLNLLAIWSFNDMQEQNGKALTGHDCCKAACGKNCWDVALSPLVLAGRSEANGENLVCKV